jgi:hypothetical protein
VNLETPEDDILGPVISENEDPEFLIRGVCKAAANDAVPLGGFQENWYEMLQPQVIDFGNSASAKGVLNTSGGYCAKISNPSTLKDLLFGCFSTRHEIENYFSELLKPEKFQELDEDHGRSDSP